MKLLYLRGKVCYNYRSRHKAKASACNTRPLTTYTKGTRAMADIDSTPNKFCRKCGKEKPATTEFFYKAPKGRLGLHAWCKSCVAEYDKERGQKPETKARRHANSMRPENIEKRRAYAQRPEAKAKKAIRDNSPQARKRNRRNARLTPPEKRAGFIYLLLAENGVYKIGRASNAERRIRNIQTVSPVAIVPICVIESGDSFEMECELHTLFKSKRLHGEWFALSPEDVEYIKGLAE